MEMFQIQQLKLNGYEWFVAGLAPTLEQAFEAAHAMAAPYQGDAPWMKMRVVEPTMPSYIRN